MMRRVHPTQRFGITAGVPRGFEVAVKNGFYPCDTSCPGPPELDGTRRWRVSSTGFVRRAGEADGWAITILTDGNRTQRDGIELVEAISQVIATALYGEEPAPRAVDRAVCTTFRAHSTRATVLADLGLAPSERNWRRVLRVSGGHPPLRGQLLCSPALSRIDR